MAESRYLHSVTSIRLVEEQYDRYPYPQPSVVVQHLPAGFSLRVLDFLLRRRAAERFAVDSHIWIAGCGTQQAAMWALANPSARILATDLSTTVLTTAEDLTRQLGIENVRFAKQDIGESNHQSAFDLVVSTGVIHHMPDPELGAAKLRQALKPTGAALLMVYSRMHRAPLESFRHAHALLAQVGLDPDARYQLAGRMLVTALDSERCSPVGAEALELLRARLEDDRPFVADALMHPLEHSYDVDGLLGLLAAGDLEHQSWLYPAQWDADAYLDDPEILQRFEQLEAHDQWRALYHLTGYASPLLEVLATPQGAATPAPYELAELLSMRPLLSAGQRLFRVHEGKVVAQGEAPPFEENDGKLRGRARGGFGSVRRFSLPAEVRPVLEACDGKRTLEHILDDFEADFDRQELLMLLARMLPADYGLLTLV